MENKKRIVRFESGYDCIHFECICDTKTCGPGTMGSHGMVGLLIRFVLKGEKGAVQFVIRTGWTPQYAETYLGNKNVCEWESHNTYPSELGCHFKTPQYEDHKVTRDSCEFCDGEPCYYACNSLGARDAMYSLVNGGDEALWKFLEVYYDCSFNDGDYPKPFEYIKSPRG